MTTIRLQIDTKQQEIFCWDEETGVMFYIPLMDEKKIISYLKKMYPRRYKETRIKLNIVRDK